MGQKLKFVLSDLHIGAGYANQGGNPLEDFTATKAFVDLLHHIWQESEREQREVELIINGDFFEFLQVPAVDNYDPTGVYAKELFLDSSEKASIKRLNIITTGHTEIFNALADFMHVEAPQRRITIIKGNHDVHLYWPGVKKRMREILGASGTRASLLSFANEFISREKIYVEHGHQRAEKITEYRDPYDPRSPEDPNQLYYPLGSYFVIDFLNEAERNWWFVDNVKPVTTLIWYALSQNFDLASKGLLTFMQHAPTLTSATANAHHNSLLHHLEDSSSRQKIAQRYRDDGMYRQQFHEQIQHYFNQTQLNYNEAVCRSEISDDPIQIGQAHQKQQHLMLCQAAEEVAIKEGAKIVLFGHSHTPTQETLQNGSSYINTGSWIENFYDTPLKTWQALFGGLQKQGDILPQLPYARIDYDENNIPTATLLYINQEYDKNSVEVSPKNSAADRAEAKNFFERNFPWIAQFLGVNS